MTKALRTLASRASLGTIIAIAAALPLGCASSAAANKEPAWYAASEPQHKCDPSTTPEGWPWSKVIVGWGAWDDWDECQLRSLLVLPPD